MASIDNSILDYIATKGAENRVINLNDVFSGEGLTFTVTNSNGDIVNASVEGSQLVIDYTDVLGYSDLKITATDASGHSVTDSLRVRVAGENAYTIAVLPDTQDYTNAQRIGTFETMTQWLVDNKDSLGIQFVTHVGDITTENSNTHWDYAKQALSILDGKIPYGLSLGNHDGISGSYTSSNINNHFSVDDLKNANGENFGGTYDQEAELSNNTYSTFTAPDGTKWMVLNIEFGAREDVLRWAGDVIEGHLDHRVILTNHSYMTWAGRHDATGAPLYDEGTGYDYGLGSSVEGATDGETMYRELIQKYPNVTFTFSGHIFGDGAETLVSHDQYGNPVFQMMVNYQNGVAGEITGNDGEGSGSAGGNGAIRLVTIDPDTGAIYTSTYFAGLDSYSDPARGDGELDRDGLTGPYRGHEETYTGLELGPPAVVAVARAGNDQFVSAAEGQDKAQVTLTGDRSLNPGDDEGLDYVWTDARGNVVAEGAAPTLELGAGQHQLTLTVTDSNGKVSTDDVRVVVSNQNTLLVDNFNDGNADGWGAFSPPVNAQQGSTTDFGIAALPEAGADATISQMPKLTPSQAVTVDFGAATGRLTSYTLAFDILIPSGSASGFTSLFQTDPANTSDADFFIRNNGAGIGGPGIGGVYPNGFRYDEWQRVVIKIEADGNSSAVMSKYVDGVKVGTQSVDPGRYAIDLERGLLLFSDEDGETSVLYTSSVMLTDQLYTDAQIEAMGGSSAGGILSEKPSDNSFQLDFSGDEITDQWGDASASVGEANAGTGSFFVKGSVHSRQDGFEVQDAAEGRVWEQSDGGDKMLIWKDAAAKEWSDYEFEATLKATDNDGIGVTFYYQDDQNHYKLILNAETNTRQLVMVKDGQETVLAQDHGGTPWSRDFQIKVAVDGDQIRVFMDGHDLFGTVTAEDGLSGGTVGFISSQQRASQFDNVTVNRIDLTAHAGDHVKTADLDGDGRVSVTLDASGSYGRDDIASFVWTDEDGNIVAEGETAQIELGASSQRLTLTVTDSTGKTASDTVLIDALSNDRVLMSDDFSSTTMKGWTIVDEGEMGGAGPDGRASEWVLRDGALVQLSDLKSRELTWNGASNSDPWQTGWSPLGDGVNVLRKGTYALYDDPKALEWQDYAVEATVQSPDNGALGLLFYYQDAQNYYKLELDANGDYDRNPRNGAGSLFQLIQVKDGVEKYLTQFPAKYTPNQAFQLRVEVLDGKIQAFVDGSALFAYAIEDRAQSAGTVGLFSWDSAGVSFDNLQVTSLVDIEKPEGESVTGNWRAERFTGTAGDDVISGRQGHDTIDGGRGDDTISGDNGDDLLLGGQGDDHLFGGWGQDMLDGGTGNDTLDAGHGDSVLIGGLGDDLLLGRTGADTLSGGDGHDTLDAGGGDDSLDGGLGNDVLYGRYGHDTLDGGAGNDLIDGGTGNDLLQGGAGNDTLIGGQGDDTLIGGQGDDLLQGSSGRDVFVFAAGFGADTVAGFGTVGVNADLLEFDSAVFADFAAVLEAAEAQGRNTVLTADDGSTITLSNIRVSALNEDMFSFV